MEYFGFYGGGNDAKAEEKQQRPEFSQKILNVLENRKTKEQEVYLVVPTYDTFNERNFSEQSISPTESFFQTCKIKVKPHNTVKMKDLAKVRIKYAQFLHSLAVNKKEFEYLLSNYWEEILRTKMELHEFGLYVLAMREIYKITRNEKLNIFNIKNPFHLKMLYQENFKYLIFAEDVEWRTFVLQPNEFSKISTFKTKAEFVKGKFSDKELKELLQTHMKDYPGYHDKTLQWIKKTGYLNYVIETVEKYIKNQEIFLSHGIDFNVVKINDEKSLKKFEDEVFNLGLYKIFNKILTRLDSDKRQAVRNHTYLYTDYKKIAERMYRQGLTFDRIEPILKKMHTYRDASYLYKALLNATEDVNLYTIFEKAKDTPNVKVMFFDEEKQRMLIKISSYAAMQRMGSPAWCITNHEDQYRRYKGIFNRFFIYYDARRNFTSKTSSLENVPYTIGYTIGPFKGIKYAHDYDDLNVVNYVETINIVIEYKQYF